MANFTSLGLKQLKLNFKPAQKFFISFFFFRTADCDKGPQLVFGRGHKLQEKVLAVKCSVVKLQQSGL